MFEVCQQPHTRKKRAPLTAEFEVHPVRILLGKLVNSTSLHGINFLGLNRLFYYIVVSPYQLKWLPHKSAMAPPTRLDLLAILSNQFIYGTSRSVKNRSSNNIFFLLRLI